MPLSFNASINASRLITTTLFIDTNNKQMPGRERAAGREGLMAERGELPVLADIAGQFRADRC